MADQRADPARLRDHPDRAGARARRQAASRASSRAARSCSRARAERAKRLDAGERPDFLAETKAIRDGDWKIAPVPDGAAVPPRRDHRAGRRQDGHQRLQLGRRFVHDRLRGLELAALDEPDPGPDQHRPGDPPHADVQAGVAGGQQELQAQRQDRDAAGAAARLAPRREARHRSTASASRGGIFDFALFMFHNAKEQLARGAGPYFYLPKMESHLEARLWNEIFVADAERARPAAGHDQGDGADRDHPRRVRDGRDPLRAARAQRRPERRPLGLHLQLHQEVQARPRLLPRRPRQGDDDGAVHARLCAAAAARSATSAARRRSAA